MINKFKKYFTYFSKFINSDKKGELISLLYLQIKDKGLIRGAQELLHIKSGGGNTDELSREQFQYKDYDSSQAIELPVPPMPLVSIVIPVYNNLEATYNCIRSIYENTATPNYEVIIADDASPTNMAVLQDMCKNCIYIKNSVNLGYLRNCNNAAKSARGTYLVLLNNDTQVQAGWLEELLYVFNNFPDAGLVGGMLIYPEVLLQEAGGIIWKDGSGCNYGNRDNVNGGAYNYIKEADYVSGASYMITKALWEVIGGYDERYAPAYHEDSDLCFEVRRRGKKVYYTPFSKVMHEEGLSHGKSLKQGLKKYQVINKKKFIEKWGDELKEKSAKDKNVFIERERGHGKKYVLIIDHNVPTVDKDAGSRTINNIVNTLLGMGYQVKFMVPNMYPIVHYMAIQQRKGVEVLHGNQFIHWNHYWENYFRTNIQYFDAILLSRSSICIPYIEFFQKIKYKGITIYYGHDLAFLRLEREYELTKNADTLKLADKIRHDELKMYNSCQHALVISHNEVAYLQCKVKGTVLHYTPLFIFPPIEAVKPYKERKGLLFVGGFHHPPNTEGIIWFIEQMYGRLHDAGIPLTIAGSEMPERLYGYAKQYPLIKICPDVPTEALEVLYQNTRVAIVPLLSGAGVKGKVIEAMAKGVPVVGTSFAFEGLFKDATFLYEDSNTPTAFIAAVEAIYGNEGKWQICSEFGLGYIDTYFHKDKMKEVFERILIKG